MKEMMKLVNEVIPKDQKIIIFSTFSSVLDVITKCFDNYNKDNKNKIKYLQVDGSVKGEDRMDRIHKFKTQDYRVFLITYKTGSKGLNLTCANHVICMEPWWNPTTEDQAVHRAWRIGQVKDVTIYRIIIKNTIEDGMIRLLWDEKRKIENEFLSISYGYEKSTTTTKTTVSTSIDKYTMAKLLGY